MRSLLLALLVFVGLIAFLSIWASLFQLEIAPEHPGFDSQEVEEAQRLRQASIDPDNPFVIWQNVDYSEGPEASWWPKGGVPVLAALVQQGKLPPVEERVGPEPVVLKGVDGLGRYGGAFVKSETAATQKIAQLSTRYSASSLVRWSPYGYPVVPRLAKSLEAGNQFREYIFHLRRGVR